jgi:capsular exopolysaccharide synthesis family protein
MSRIQRILDKAEREGGLHRTRPVVNPAAPGGSSATALEELEEPRAPAAVAPVEAPHASRATLFPAARAIRGTVLAPYLVAATQGTGIAAEQYRALRTRIMQTSHGGAAHTVLITSPGRGEGKSLTVANLALTMGQDYQRRICVLDADFRATRQHRLFGLAETPGLSDVLLGRSPLEEALVTIEELGLTVLPAGLPPDHPAELLGTSAMRRTLDTLRSGFDRVVIDAPAAAPLADVGILMALVDRVLLIVRAGITSKPAIHEALAAIDQAKCLGFVLNDAT